jgi:hypothetical protein
MKENHTDKQVKTHEAKYKLISISLNRFIEAIIRFYLLVIMYEVWS